MARKIYLLGLRHSEFPFVKEEKEAVDLSETKNMFVIDFARYGEKYIKEKKKADFKMFKGYGAKKVEFTSNLNDEEIKQRIKETDLIYIAGGDTIKLLGEIKQKNLEGLIKSFEGIIVGNSAGAYVCCKGFVEETNRKIIPGFGMVNIFIKAHYVSEFDNMLSELSEKEKIYAIPDSSVIVVEKGKLSFRGDVYKFVKGKKEKIN